MDEGWERTANVTASNYAITKFMLIAHAKAVAEREAALGTSVHAYSMRPGIVETHLLHHFNWTDCEMGCLMSGYMGCIPGVCPLSPEQAAATLTWLAVSDVSTLHMGEYHYRCKKFPLPMQPGWNWKTSPNALLKATAKWTGQQ